MLACTVAVCFIMRWPRVPTVGIYGPMMRSASSAPTRSRQAGSPAACRVREKRFLERFANFQQLADMLVELGIGAVNGLAGAAPLSSI